MVISYKNSLIFPYSLAMVIKSITLDVELVSSMEI